MLKKFSSFLLIFVFLFALSSCKDKKEQEGTAADSSETAYEENNSTAENLTSAVQTSDALTEAQTAEILTTEVQTTEMQTTGVQITEVQTTGAYTAEILTTEALTDSASSWDKEKIISYYKNAAELTGTSVTSLQTVGLQDISVNNGQLGGVFSFVTPILSSFLSAKATEIKGITGEYMLLTAEDVASAVAYDTSEGTAVEITLNTQASSAASDVTEGSVAHGIYVVGDLLSVMSQLNDKGLPIEISVEDTLITYSEPVIKVLVGSDGKIVKGTWSCNIEISLSDYKFAGSAVDSTKVILNNKITAGGGF